MFNTLRLTGLASGIDTEEMIQTMMRAERVKVDRVEQDRQLLLWKQEAYNSLNKKFANFIINSRNLFDLTQVSRNGSFLPNSYENLDWVKKATSSNPNIALVSSSSKVVDGNYAVDVERLAEGVTAASSEEINGDELLDAIFEDSNIESFTFSINGKDIEVVKGDAMTDVVKKINSADAGVKTSYDRSQGRFFLQTTSTGKDVKISLEAKDEYAKKFLMGSEEEELSGLKLRVTHYVENEASTEDLLLDRAYHGQNAVIHFSGAENIESSTNRITVNGITMDLMSTGEFNINVSTDVDGIYDKIKEFIDEYNSLVEETNRLLGEKQYRDYRPLTAEQRKEMDSKDIELWEEKAKSGLLRGDSLISSTMSRIRRSLYEKSEGEFTGPFKLITDIGIGTAQYERGSAGGKLVIDEGKLKAAIAKDPEAVLEFLFKGSDKENGEIGGIVTRIHENIIEGMEDIIKKSGTGGENDLYRSVKSNILLDFVTEYSSVSLLDKDVLQYSRRIDDLNAMLFRKENDYYAKFAAMETAIARMQEQSAWMMQQFMG